MNIRLLGFLAIVTLSLVISCAPQEAEETKEILTQKVELQEAIQKSFIHQIRVQGNVESEKDILLNAEMGGLITNVSIKEGQKVSKGQVIAQIDASIFSSNMQELKTQLEYAEYMLEKQEALHKNGVGSEFELEAAKSQVNALKASMNSLSTQQGKATIRAPFSGVIDQVYARQGQMAGPSAPIARLVNNNSVDIVASISEKHYSKIKIGTPISVSFPNYGDTVINLDITSIGNYIDPTNRTFRIKSTIVKNNFFLPNMLAELSITDVQKEGIVIPSVSILKDQDNNDYVYVAKKQKPKSKEENERFIVEKVVINVISRFDGEALIESDSIRSKDLIVTKGARGIQSKDIVRID